MSSPEHGSPSFRREVELKREMKMEQEAARSTFQPTLSTRRARDNSTTKPATGSRFDSLYNDAVKRKTQGIKVVVDESNNTFKPTISPKSRSASRERGTTELYDSLHRASGAGRAAVKEAPVVANMFKPTISKRASSIERSSSVTDMNSRLSASLRKSQSNMDREKDEAAKRDAEICTFSPKLYRSRSASRSRDEDSKVDSVTERLLKYGEKMKVRLQEEQILRLKEDLTNATFKPNVTKSRSRSSTPQKSGNEGDVYTRLNQRLEKDTTTLIAERDVELTFQPKTSRSSVIVPNDGDNVHERLFKEAVSKRMESQKEQRLSQEEEALKCTFVPQISHLKTNDNASVDTSTSTPVFERLHDSKQFMQKILSQIKIDLEMSECTFQPSVAPKAFKSERRPSEGSVHVRLDKDAYIKKLDAQKREEEKVLTELQGSTFRPQVPESSQGIVRRKSCIEGDDASAIHDRLNSTHTVSSLGGYINTSEEVDPSPRSIADKATVDATVERLLAAGGKRKDDLRASRSERAFEEMKGMTFSPSINENSVKIATRQKEREKERLKEDGGEESPMDSSTSSTTSSMSRIQVRSTSAQRRSTFSGRAADSGIYRRSSECDIPHVGYVAKIFTSEKSANSRTPVSSEKSGKLSLTSDLPAPPISEPVTHQKGSSLNSSRSPSVGRKASSAETLGTPVSKKKSTPVAESRKTPVTAKKNPTANVEIRSINGKKSSSRDVYEVETSPVRGKEASSPVRRKEASSPVRVKEASSPARGKEASSPVRGKEASSPVRGKEASSLVRGKEASSPVRGKEASSPVLVKEASSPILEKKVPAPVLIKEASSPVLDKIGSSPVLDKIESSPVLVKEVSSPVSNDEVSAPVSDEKAPSLIVGKEAPSPVLDMKVSSPVLGKEAPSPVLDMKVSSPDMRVSTPVLGKEATSPVLDKRVSTPVLGKEATSPVLDKKVSTPVLDKKLSSPDRRVSAPVLGKEVSSPITNNKTPPVEIFNSPIDVRRSPSTERSRIPLPVKRSPSQFNIPIPTAFHDVSEDVGGLKSSSLRVDTEV